MKYYFNKTVEADFLSAVNMAKTALEEKGFGVLTEIDVKKTFKKKLNINFRKYVILGACNPSLAHQALTVEDKIGILLPCNIIIQEIDSDHTEIAAVDPAIAMLSVENTELEKVAMNVRDKLASVIDVLG